jgi:hypothetical protein
MGEPEQIPEISFVQRYWWTEAWIGARPRFIAICTEIIGSVSLLLALAIFYLVLRLMIAAGIPAEEINFLKGADLWAVKAVFLTSSFTFVIQYAISCYASLIDSKNAIRGTR